MTTEGWVGGNDEQEPASVDDEHTSVDPAMEAFAMLWQAASTRAKYADKSNVLAGTRSDRYHSPIVPRPAVMHALPS